MTVANAPSKTPPCHACRGACCKLSPHHKKPRYAHAVTLNESDRGNPRIRAVSRKKFGDWVIPHRQGQCPFLDGNDRCKIYEVRPLLCQEFNCRDCNHNPRSLFLQLNPEVLTLLQIQQ